MRRYRPLLRTGASLGAALCAVAVAGCGGSDGSSAATPTVYAAYVLLAPGADGSTLALARAVVEPGAPGEPPCPTLRGGKESIAMSLRGNPFGFPVDVCEARVPFDRQLHLSWTGQDLPVARRNPARLTVVGDTGCKKSDCPGEVPASPFDTVAATAASQAPPPELVVHVGDYNYRGTSSSVPVKGGGTLDVYDAGDDAPDDPECQLESPYVSQNAAYSDNPDTWENWRIDFFEPAAPLLAAAPWVFVRGNHELCSRAGPGWFYFLDPGAAAHLGGTGEVECPPQGDDQPLPPPVLPYLLFSPPYVLDLGSLRLAVIDSANACDGYAPAATADIYAEQLAQVLAAAPPGQTTWIATHRPFWGATNTAGDSIDATLQRAWAIANETDAMPPVELLLSGHIHIFQSLTFPEPAAPRPPQLIVGTGGVALAKSPVGTFDALVAGDTAEIVGISHFSFLHVSALAADGSWTGALLDQTGATLASCASANLPGSLCSE